MWACLPHQAGQNLTFISGGLLTVDFAHVEHLTRLPAAARIVNAIPFVCAAAPGMLDALQVPLPIGRGLVRA